MTSDLVEADTLGVAEALQCRPKPLGGHASYPCLCICGAERDVIKSTWMLHVGVCHELVVTV